MIRTQPGSGTGGVCGCGGGLQKVKEASPTSSFRLRVEGHDSLSLTGDGPRRSAASEGNPHGTFAQPGRRCPFRPAGASGFVMKDASFEVFSTRFGLSPRGTGPPHSIDEFPVHAVASTWP